MYSEALTLADSYVPFTDIGAAVFEMLAAARDITICESDKRELTDRFVSMPAHADVAPALRELSDDGFRLFTLSNNPLTVQRRQLESAGIIDNFERCFSVDEVVRRYKPAREAYVYVETEMRAQPSDLVLVACHTWDTIWALGAGWRAALVKRPLNHTLNVGPQPDIVGSDLHDVAHQILTRHGAAQTS
jgi:2-haloacid dehalogenase